MFVIFPFITETSSPSDSLLNDENSFVDFILCFLWINLVINGKLNMTLVNPLIGIQYFSKQVTITSKLSILGLWFTQGFVLESSWWHFKC